MSNEENYLIDLLAKLKFSPYENGTKDKLPFLENAPAKISLDQEIIKLIAEIFTETNLENKFVQQTELGRIFGLEFDVDENGQIINPKLKIGKKSKSELKEKTIFGEKVEAISTKLNVHEFAYKDVEEKKIVLPIGDIHSHPKPFPQSISDLINVHNLTAEVQYENTQLADGSKRETAQEKLVEKDPINALNGEIVIAGEDIWLTIASKHSVERVKKIEQIAKLAELQLEILVENISGDYIPQNKLYETLFYYYYFALIVLGLDCHLYHGSINSKNMELMDHRKFVDEIKGYIIDIISTSPHL
jgi:hypothetical protein